MRLDGNPAVRSLASSRRCAPIAGELLPVASASSAERNASLITTTPAASKLDLPSSHRRRQERRVKRVRISLACRAEMMSQLALVFLGALLLIAGPDERTIKSVIKISM